MPIKLNTASGGGVTLSAANTATDKTITVPAVDGTMVLTGVSGNVDINAAGANNLTLSTNTTERARIDSSGNLLVGTTSGSARLHAVGASTTSSDFSARFQNSAATDLITVRNDGVINTGLASASPYNNTTASAANVFVSNSGVLQRSTSSLKYKTSVQDTTHGLADVLRLRAVTYKGRSEEDGEKIFGGLIAEEVHDAGLTEFVQYADDGTPDALAYGNMVSLAFKAIQEQQQMIETLQAKVAALEAQ